MPMECRIHQSLAERHLRVRASLVQKGTSFSGWCRANGVQPPNAYKAMMGEWRGPKADALVQKLCRAAGVEE